MTEQPAPEQIYVRLPGELHAAIKRRSEQEERTMAQTIRLALRYYLQTTAPIAPPEAAQ